MKFHVIEDLDDAVHLLCGCGVSFWSDCTGHGCAEIDHRGRPTLVPCCTNCGAVPDEPVDAPPEAS